MRSNSVMFRDDLGFIKNRYLDRFQWINIMDEDQGSDLLNGRIDNDKGSALHRARLINRTTDEALICGLEAMMSEVSRGFCASGLDEAQIHFELFAHSSEDSCERLDKAQRRIDTYGEEKVSRVTVVADGRAIDSTSPPLARTFSTRRSQRPRPAYPARPGFVRPARPASSTARSTWTSLTASNPAMSTTATCRPASLTRFDQDRLDQ